MLIINVYYNVLRVTHKIFSLERWYINKKKE